MPATSEVARNGETRGVGLNSPELIQDLERLVKGVSFDKGWAVVKAGQRLGGLVGGAAGFYAGMTVGDSGLIDRREFLRRALVRAPALAVAGAALACGGTSTVVATREVATGTPAFAATPVFTEIPPTPAPEPTLVGPVAPEYAVIEEGEAEPTRWTPPTLEQSRVGVGGAIPEGLVGFGQVVGDGFGLLGVIGTEVEFSDNDQTGDAYRWAMVARDPGTGLAYWSVIEAGGVAGYREQPTYFALVGFVGDDGNEYSAYLLDTENVKYQTVPGSEKAEVVFGASNEFPVLVRQPVTIDIDGQPKQVFSEYFDIFQQKWMAIPELAGKGVAIEGKLEDYTQEQQEQIQELKGQLESNRIVTPGYLGLQDEIVENRDFSLSIVEVVSPDGAEKQEVAVAKDRNTCGYLVSVEGWGETKGQIHFVLAPQKDGLTQELFLATDAWAEIPPSLRLQPGPTAQVAVAYVDETGKVAGRLFTWRGQRSRLSEWSFKIAYAGSRLGQRDEIVKLLVVDPPEVDASDEAVKLWIEDMLSKDAQGNFVHFSVNGDYELDENNLRGTLELVKTMDPELRAIILSYDGNFMFDRSNGSWFDADGVHLDRRYLDDYGKLTGKVHLIAIILHELNHSVQHLERGCSVSNNAELSAYYLQFKVLQGNEVFDEVYKKLLETGGYPICS